MKGADNNRKSTCIYILRKHLPIPDANDPQRPVVNTFCDAIIYNYMYDCEKPLNSKNEKIMYEYNDKTGQATIRMNRQAAPKR